MVVVASVAGFSTCGMICNCRQYPFNDSTEISLWDLTKDKLLAAMFMLGRVFPLQDALDRHPLATFIEQHHHEWRHQLPGSNRVWQYFNIDQPVSPENSSFSVDAKLTDDDNTTMQHCGRCNRRRKEVKPPCLFSSLPDVVNDADSNSKDSTSLITDMMAPPWSVLPGLPDMTCKCCRLTNALLGQSHKS